MSPVGTRHIAFVNRLNDKLTERFHGHAVVSIQNPVRLGDRNEPQPDIVVFRWRDDYYERDDPLPEDVLLIVEVADSSLRYDRMRKSALYSRFDLGEYWIVNVDDRELEVYRSPDASGYAEHAVYGAGASVTLSAVPDVTLAVDEILGQSSA